MSASAKTIDLTSLADTRNWVKQQLLPLMGERMLLLLQGDLGVGKTQLVKFIVEELAKAEKEEACSPTYAILNHYQLGEVSVDHVDLYRLESEEDLESTGFWDLFAKPSGYILIEWADRLNSEMLPPNWPRLIISIEQIPEESRRITVTS